jgi:hypothetical protein
MLPPPPWDDKGYEYFLYHTFPEELPALAQKYENEGREEDASRVRQLIEKRKTDTEIVVL